MFRRFLLASHQGSSFRSEPEEAAPIRRTSRRLSELLALLPPGDRSLEDVEGSSPNGAASVLSYPFSEDISPRFSDSAAEGHFSAAHEEVMRGLRPEVLDDSVCSSCSSCDTCSTDTWEALGIDEEKIAQVQARPLPPQVEQHIYDMIRGVEVKPERAHRSVEGEGSCRSSGRPRLPAEPDFMAGLWNMLATYDEFVVTPPGFNVYQQEKPHWLDQEPIPWEVREKARLKCAKWLLKHHQ